VGAQAVALCALLAACGRFGFDSGSPPGDGSTSLASTCTTHWCWDYPPGVEHTTLRAIAGTSATNVWAVGDAGVIRVWDGSTWTRFPIPTNDALVAIVMRAPDDVFVAAGEARLWHWNGSDWASVQAPAGSSVAAFWQAPSGAIVAAGDVGTMSVDNTVAASRPSRVAATAVHGMNETDVWVTGQFNTLSHWNGSAWSELVFGDFPHAVWETATTTWVGADSDIWSCTATACTVSLALGDIRGMWGAADNDIWAVGGVALAHYNGGSWSMLPLGGTPLQAAWGTSGSDVWAVGVGGRITHFDGAVWTEMGTPDTSFPEWQSGWASAKNDLWLGRPNPPNNGIYHYDTLAVQEFQGNTVGDEMWGRSATDIYATDVGNDTVMHFDGTTWSDEPGLTLSQPQALTVTQAGEVIAGSYSGNGQIWAKPAGTWSLAFTSATGSLFTGACASTLNNDVVFVARFGDAVTRIGGTWAQVDTPTGRFLLACAFAGSEVWAVGGDAVEHYKTGIWTDITTFPSKHILTDIVAAGSNLLVSTSNGKVIAGDGATWQEESTPTGFDLEKLVVAPDGTVYALGVDGVILHRQ